MLLISFAPAWGEGLFDSVFPGLAGADLWARLRAAPSGGELVFDVTSQLCRPCHGSC